MPIAKSFSRFAVASLLLVSFTARAEFLGEDSLFSGLRRPTKGQDGLPKNLKSFDRAFTLNEDVSSADDDRSPASVQRPTIAKPKAQHWSASSSDGFEFKIRVKQQVSAVWVLKRDDHYDLIFANNTGSRVNMALPAEQFYALKNAATDLRAPASDMAKCKDSFIQLELVEKSTHKLVSTCLNTKSKAADELRLFGSTLTAYVR